MALTTHKNVGNRQLKNQDPFIILEAAIEGISYSMSQLESVDGFDKLSGPAFVDLTARLNAQANGLEKILKPMKEQIKAAALADDSKTVKGKVYQAVVQKITKIVLDTAKIKAFLGRNLPSYQTERDEVHISFEVKE